MKEEWENERPTPWLGLSKMKAGIFAAVSVIAISYLVNPPKSVSFVNPKIKSSPFFWPEGCERKIYKFRDEIKRECLTVYIGDGAQWGWRRGPKTADYYRISNNAVRVSCSGLYGNCHAFEIVEDVFVVSN